MATLTPASSPDMAIAIKVVIAGKDEMRKFKLPLKELGANTLPDKVCPTDPLVAFFLPQPFGTSMSLRILRHYPYHQAPYANVEALSSFALCSTSLRHRRRCLNATLIALHLTSSSITPYHRFISNCIVLLKQSRSSEFESLLLRKNLPSRSKRPSLEPLSLSVFLLAVTSTHTFQTLRSPKRI